MSFEGFIKFTFNKKIILGFSRGDKHIIFQDTFPWKEIAQMNGILKVKRALTLFAINRKWFIINSRTKNKEDKPPSQSKTKIGIFYFESDNEWLRFVTNEIGNRT